MEKKGGIVTKTEYLDIRLIVAGSDNRSVLHETCAKCKGYIGREKICKQKDRVTGKYYYKTLYL